MARTVRDTKLESRAARLKLEVNLEPYWKGIDQGLHIGYYKGSTGSTWIARYRKENKKYVKTTLGVTDDVIDADGLKILSFSQAQEKSREWFNKQSRIDAGIDNSYGKKYTVANALDDYLAWFKHERKSYSYTAGTIETQIKPELGNIELTKITPKAITTWRNKLAITPPRLRSRKGEVVNYDKMGDDPDSLRRRKSTVNRILTILKAALNHAFREGYVASDEAWRKVKPFHNVDSPTIRYLNKDECIRLINACDPDFRSMVTAALFTGCRYGELTRLTSNDFHSDSGTLLVRESKSGKPRRVVLTQEGQRFFQQHTNGKKGEDFIFLRENDQEPWGKSHQARRLNEACKHAHIKPAISFHILRHSHASQLAMQGVSMAIIATQLGHSDTRVCERHYAHLCPDYVADTIRAKLPELGIVHQNNVVNLKRGIK
ncbi:MAG: site-specific integrase [Alphaproteobacteria bacterium]|nr:site-specific integrase [Alphaproteobacteria bacterium]